MDHVSGVSLEQSVELKFSPFVVRLTVMDADTVFFTLHVGREIMRKRVPLGIDCGVERVY